jgi:hypothetical protein
MSSSAAFKVPQPSRLVLGLAAAVTGSMVTGSPAFAAPNFVSKPSEVFEDFTALNEPRTEVPVGALWIEGYGPHGEGAAADNLVTVRSLSGVALSGELQIRLTLGLAALLNITPGYGSHLNARFSDLSIVRVKDLTKIAGPQGEPRIFEALRAGTITISTDSDIGLDLGGRLEATKLPLVGTADTGRKRSFSIDGRDLFIAYRVASSLPSRSDRKDAVVRAAGKSAELYLGGYRLRLELPVGGAGEAATAAVAGSPCGATSVTLWRSSNEEVGAPLKVTHDFFAPSAEALTLALPVPVSDGEGGLLTALILRRSSGGDAAKGKQSASCAELRLSASLEGQRVKMTANPKAPGW